MLDYLTGWRRRVWLAVLALMVLAIAADVVLVAAVVGMLVYVW